MRATLSIKTRAWGYAAQVLNIAAGLLLLIPVAAYLPPVVVGLWLVFVTLGSMAQLMELGFQPSIARQVAYVKAGALALQPVGISKSFSKGSVDQELASDLLFAARWIYRRIALAVLLILIAIGTPYIATLVQQDPITLSAAYGAWLLFSIGQVVQFYFGYLNAWLMGCGAIVEASKVTVFSRSLFIVFGVIACVVGFDLWGLGAAALLSSIASRWVAYHYSRKIDSLTFSSQIKHHTNRSRDLVLILWHNAIRQGAVQLGSFLALRANLLIASSFMGLATAASYGITMTVLLALMALSMTVLNLHLPQINSAQSDGNHAHIVSLYGEAVIQAALVFVCGVAALLVMGQPLLNIAGSQSQLLPSPQLLILGVIILLELNHAMAGTYLTTRNKVPFVSAAIISGTTISVLSLLTVHLFGIWGLIAVQGLVQLAYNNWRWPTLAMKDLGVTYAHLVALGWKHMTCGRLR
jgi:O-antigen/teichoic acid export membrane protein